ncbi:GerAB/ArcD/ProY family transporter [Brevibacillus centrosporus]|uniref:GerAB/ArcD/ProY family transporter n=1 Tax=Brevibacillus centrosporus TaxID=54910 RepID=UPI000F0A8242|nr:GerAB/ArcD/ProY family transporter [Brevibacillus centrosporus]MEC2129661.1 GerAB/ArcD/ProY family transporter [Brevibacillus centrosporus]MED4909090.1 GerAB/ArcD/ProY family transporter [Brevibacillus centrosporus]RNB65741.1 hypothetical protein EDM55_24160 [Brevibacillus centrosporus]GED30022.1 hypothetical protein BCE02nite_11630 [Brevibacillus centrosporus]
MRLSVVFIAIHLSVIFYLYPSDIIGVSHFGHWLYIITGFLLEFLLLFLYLSGLSTFPKEDITSIVNRCGPWWARLLLLPLLVYFFMSFVLLIRSHAELLTIIFLPTTPIWAILLLLFIIPLFVAIHGHRTILRGSFALMITILPLILFSLFSCFQNINIHFFFPIEPVPTFWYDEHFLKSLLAHSPFLSLGIFSRYLSFAVSQTRKYLYAAMLFLLPFYLLAVYIPILTFAPDTAQKLRFPIPVALDTVNLEWLFFDRITMFYVVATVSFIYVNTSVMVWIMSTLTVNLYTSISRTKICWVIIGVAYVICILVPDWETIDWLISLDTPLRLYCIIFIPLLIYGIGFYYRRRNLT